MGVHASVWLAVVCTLAANCAANVLQQNAECSTSWPGWGGIKYLFTLSVLNTVLENMGLKTDRIATVVIRTRKQASMLQELNPRLEIPWETLLTRKFNINFLLR
jgi:hypothetical protein